MQDIHVVTDADLSELAVSDREAASNDAAEIIPTHTKLSFARGNHELRSYSRSTNHTVLALFNRCFDERAGYCRWFQTPVCRRMGLEHTPIRAVSFRRRVSD